MRKGRVCVRGFVIAVFCLFSAMAAHAVGTMVALSTAAYGCGNDADGSAIAVDGSGNIVVTGSIYSSSPDYVTIKYDNNLAIISSATYDTGYGGYAKGVAVDSADNIFVTGYVNDGSQDDYYTIKYDKSLNTVCSKRYDSGLKDWAYGVAVDGSGNVIVTGHAWSGTASDMVTIKYDNDLNVISSATYDSGYGDYARGVAVDGSGNIFVAGYAKNSSGSYDYLTLKYDSNLKLVSSVRYDSGNKDYAYGVAVDGSGNVIVAGYVYNGANYDFLTLKYDNALNFISSATYNTGVNEYAYGVAVDSWGNIVVPGAVVNSSWDCLTVKYDGDLNLISTATYNGGAEDYVQAAAVDGSGNIFATGESYVGGKADIFAIKYRNSPAVASISPVVGAQSQTLDVTVTGAHFEPGAMVAFSGSGITVSTVTYNSATSLTANITVSSGAVTGKRSISVINTNLEAGTKAGVFDVLSDTSGTSAAVIPSSSGQLTLHPASGVEITFNFPAGAFSSAVTVTANAVAAPSSGGAYVKIGNICFEISNDLTLQPQKDVTVTITYNDSDIAGLDETKLAICRYVDGRWIEMPSVVDAANNTITATLNHFSTFVLVQMVAAADLASVKVYPNPYNPKKDALGLTIANLTDEATLKIYNVAGELIAKPEYADGSGIAHWYGKNDNGNNVASGVYILFIDSPQGKKKMKIAVER